MITDEQVAGSMERIGEDWTSTLPDQSERIAMAFQQGMKPPSEDSIWQWLQVHYEISSDAAMPGKVEFAIFPASKFFFDHAQNYRCRRVTVMVSAQSGKTENAIMLLMWRIVEAPRPTMWVMAAADHCEEFAKARLYPAVEDCRPVAKIVPKEREFWTKRLLKLLTMTLYLRGSNSKQKLQSTPIGLIICDERREWKKGAIHTLRKRLTTYSDKQEISMGVAGRGGDELDTDFKEGSQTFIYFRCVHCNHSQPWRFSREPSYYFPAARECGGVVWPTNEETKPNNKWHYERVEKQARYECENPNCRYQYQNAEKVMLLPTCHELHRNPTSVPHDISMHWNALMMPWEDCSFGKIAVRFLKAVQAMKRGDLAPYETFVSEDLGEPFVRPDAYRVKGDLNDRVGSYSLGQCWVKTTSADGKVYDLEDGSCLILTFDRQLWGHPYVIRQWRKNGSSRLIEYGMKPTLDDLRALQFQHKIRNQCVAGDDGGPKASVFRQKALQWGWNVFKGEDKPFFTVMLRKDNKDISYRQGWKQTRFDPGIGTTAEGRAMMPAYLWSNPWFKERLYFFFIKGKNCPLWELPKNVQPDYFEQLNANDFVEEINADGVKEGKFLVNGADHWADCELEQIVLADIGGLTRMLNDGGQQE